MSLMTPDIQSPSMSPLSLFLHISGRCQALPSPQTLGPYALAWASAPGPAHTAFQAGAPSVWLELCGLQDFVWAQQAKRLWTYKQDVVGLLDRQTQPEALPTGHGARKGQGGGAQASAGFPRPLFPASVLKTGLHTFQRPPTPQFLWG